MYCLGRHRIENRQKSLIYRLKSFFKCSFSWNSINLLSPFLCCVSACSLLLLRAARERKILAIYWVNLCLPVQWLWIPFMLQYRCINYDYRKHQFFCMLFSRLCRKSDENRNEKLNRKNKRILREGWKRKKYKWFYFFHVQLQMKWEWIGKTKDNHEC